MKFFKKYWIGLTVTFSYIFNEFFHLLFKNVYFKTKILPCGHEKVLYYKTPVYYFGLSLFLVYLSIIVFILVLKSNYEYEIKKGLKALIAGTTGWALVELYQEFCYLAKIDEKVLYFNDGLIGQIIFICLIIILVYWSSVKSKY